MPVADVGRIVDTIAHNISDAPPGGVRASKKALAQCVEVSTGPPSGCHFFEETKTVRADHVRMTRVVQGRLGFCYTNRMSSKLVSWLVG